MSEGVSEGVSECVCVRGCVRMCVRARSKASTDTHLIKRDCGDDDGEGVPEGV